MICIEEVKKYCKDYTNIENYEQAVKDDEMWECHHRLEIKEDYINTSTELKLMNLYYNRPYSELIFLTVKEHRKIHSPNHSGVRNGMYGKVPHNKGKHLNEETKQKISKSYKPHKHTNESRNNISNSHIRTEFGRKFKLKYGITKRENLKLYSYESYYYKVHGKCSWE